MRVASNGSSLEAVAGEVLFYPARVIHAEWSDVAMPVETFFLSYQDVSVRMKVVMRTQDPSGRISQMVRWLYDDKNSSAPGIQEERQLLLKVIVAELFRNRRHQDHPMVLITRQYIQSHMAEPLSLEILSRQVNRSKYYFLRTYKTLTGRTPMEEVRIIRANAARELILSTNLPLKDIASRTGLGNEYSLSRTFRRQFNMPPGAWRGHRG